MSAVTVALCCFALLYGSSLGAMWLRQALPEQHLKDDSKDALKAGLAIIGTIGGLVLGLLVASATGSYNTQRGYVTQLAAEVFLVDRALAHYGPQAQPARAMLRETAQHILIQLWPQRAASMPNLAPSVRNEAVFDRVEDLDPKTPGQTSIKQISISLLLEIARTRYLMYSQLETTVSKPLLAMLVFWFCVTFAGLGVFAPRNITTVVGLALCSVAIAGAIYLILEMYAPFSGLMQIPSTALEDAIAHLGE